MKEITDISKQRLLKIKNVFYPDKIIRGATLFKTRKLLISDTLKTFQTQEFPSIIYTINLYIINNNFKTGSGNIVLCK
jgi:hypothetical protein